MRARAAARGAPDPFAAMLNAPTLDYTRQYEQWHDDTDQHFEAMVAYERRWPRAYRPADRDTPILDIGCATGHVVASYLREGYRSVEGIDADAGQVAKARARALPVEHVPIAASADWMAAREARYGFISAIDVLEHVPVADQIGFLRAVFRMLRPGGTFFCRVPNGNASLAGRFRYIDWTHACAFTEHSLDFVLYNAGFRDIRVDEAEPPRWRPRHLLNAQMMLRLWFRGWRRLECMAEFGFAAGARIPLTLNILGIARKST